MNVSPNAFLLPHDPPERHVGVFLVTFEALAGLLQMDGTYSLEMAGFPKGATVSFAEADNARQVVRLYVEHESLPVHYEGSVLPEMPAITATRRDVNLLEVS